VVVVEEAEETTEVVEEEAVVVAAAENLTLKINQRKKRLVLSLQTKICALTCSPTCRNILRHPIMLESTILK
jgi:hypothetical protein